MTNSSSRTFRAASAVSDIARSAPSAQILRRDLLALLQEFLGFDSGGFQSAAPGERCTVVCQNADGRVMEENFWRYSSEAPKAALEAASHGFVRDVDVVDARLRDRLGCYREFHRPAHTRVFALRYWNSDGRITVLGLSRTSGNFTDKHLEELNELFPLLAVANRCADLLRLADRSEPEGMCEDLALSPRQREIVALVARGMRNSEIAALLGITPNTVRNILADVFQKLRVTSRAELTYILTRPHGDTTGTREQLEVSRTVRKSATTKS